MTFVNVKNACTCDHRALTRREVFTERVSHVEMHTFLFKAYKCMYL